MQVTSSRLPGKLLEFPLASATVTNLVRVSIDRTNPVTVGGEPVLVTVTLLGSLSSSLVVTLVGSNYNLATPVPSVTFPASQSASQTLSVNIVVASLMAGTATDADLHLNAVLNGGGYSSLQLKDVDTHQFTVLSEMFVLSWYVSSTAFYLSL